MRPPTESQARLARQLRIFLAHRAEAEARARRAEAAARARAEATARAEALEWDGLVPFK